MFFNMVYLCFTLEGLAELIRKFAPFRVSIALSQTQLALVDRVKTVFIQGRRGDRQHSIYDRPNVLVTD